MYRHTLFPVTQSQNYARNARPISLCGKEGAIGRKYRNDNNGRLTLAVGESPCGRSGSMVFESQYQMVILLCTYVVDYMCTQNPFAQNSTAPDLLEGIWLQCNLVSICMGLLTFWRRNYFF